MTGRAGGTQQLPLLGPQPNQVNGRTAELAARIRKGNKLLWERWRLIGDMPEGEKQDRFLAGWDRGVEKLRGLCAELASLDGRCAYEGAEEPVEFCLACSVPNERWSRERCPAWKLEL